MVYEHNFISKEACISEELKRLAWISAFNTIRLYSTNEINHQAERLLLELNYLNKKIIDLKRLPQ